MSGTAIASKAAALALKPAIDATIAQIRRRGASDILSAPTLPGAREYDEAYDLLSTSPSTLGGLFVDLFKRHLSAVPEEFADDDVRIWLQRDEIKTRIVNSVRERIAGLDTGLGREFAEEAYREVYPDSLWSGGDIFDAAVAFLTLSVHAKLSPEGRAIIDNATFNTERLSSQLTELEQRIADGTLLPQPPQAIREFVERRVAYEERTRSLADDARVPKLIDLAERINGGDLKAAEQDVRILSFKATAAALSRVKRFGEAEFWLERAKDAGANDLACDHARIALHRGEFHRVFELVGDRKDPLSIFLTADALKQRDGEEAGISYTLAHLAPEEMSGFQLTTLAEWLCNVGRYEEVERLLGGASEAQSDENPTLPYARMRLRLSLMASATTRAQFALKDNALPQPKSLRTDAEGVRLRTDALSDLREFRRRLPELDGERARWFDVQRLYLQLAGEEEAAKGELQDRLRSRETAVDYAGLAFSFGIPFDEAKLREELARKRLLGTLSPSELHTAFQLSVANDLPAETATFAEQYQEELIKSGLPAALVIGIQVEIAARTGELPKAESLLQAWTSNIGAEAALKLNTIIAEVKDQTKSVELWQSTYDETHEDGDLRQLVEAMVRVDHPELGKRALDLWRSRHRLDETLEAANALFNASRDDELDALLKEVGDAGDHDFGILRHRAWAAFRAGRLAEARERTIKLQQERPDDPGLRQLLINIALEAGRWRDLAPLAHQDLANQDKRSAHQLLQAAEFARIVDDPVAIHCARAAVEKEPDNAQILLAAFGLTIRLGADWSSEAGSWLRAAADKSGPDGPVQKGTVDELLQYGQERGEQLQALDRMLLDGDAPIEFLVGPLGITLSELILVRLSDNVGERDGRHRFCLPLIAGNRLPVDLSGFNTVAFDLPALLLLEMLGVLEVALKEFPSVMLAAGTMPQLFSDYVGAHRGQLSRYEQALRIKEVIDTAAVELIQPTAYGEGDRREIDAAKSRSASYVHCFPVYKAGSFALETVEVDAASEGIVSPAGVVEALQRAGELAPDAAAAALEGLGESAQRWPDEPLVRLDRPLLINHVALSALETAGILPVLLRAAHHVMVSSEAVDDINRELRTWRSGQKPLQAIESLRDKLVTAVASGHVLHGSARRHSGDDDQGDRADHSSLYAILSDASGFDAVISADRTINKHPKLTDRRGLERPIYTVVDVLDQLRRSGALDQAGWARARQRLRESGVAFIPIEIDEIVDAVGQGDWQLGPPSALRAIASSIHLPLLRRALQLPDEQYWLGNAFAVIAIAIKRCWTRYSPEIAARAGSWLLRALPDLRQAVLTKGSADLEFWAANARAVLYVGLAQPVELDQENLDAYNDWFERVVSPRLHGADRDVIPIAITGIADSIARIGPVMLPDAEVSADSAKRWVLRRVPRPLRRLVLRERSLAATLGLADDTLEIGDHSVELPALTTFLQSIMEGSPTALKSTNGDLVFDRGEVRANGDIVATGDKITTVFDFAGLLSPVANIRTKNLEHLTVDRTLSPADLSYFIAALDHQPLISSDISRLIECLRRSPEAWVAGLDEKLDDGLTFADLCCDDERHYSVLLPAELSGDISAKIKSAIDLRRALPNRITAASVMAPFGIFPEFDLSVLVDNIDAAGIAGFAQKLLDFGDLFSLVSAFRIVSSRPDATECVEVGTRILETLVGADGDLHARAEDFCAVATSVIAYADANQLLANRSLAERRCLLLAQSGLALRGLARGDLRRPEFFQEAQNWAHPAFTLFGLLERGESRWWPRDWLHPLSIAAYARRQLRTAAANIPSEQQPEVWRTLLDLGDDKTPELLEAAAGPLDEFASSWVTQTFPTQLLREATTDADGSAALNMLFNVLMGFEQPDDLGMARDCVLSIADRTKEEDLLNASKIFLMAAWRWQDPKLGESIVDRAIDVGLEQVGNRRELAELVIGAAAAIEDAALRDEFVHRNIGRLVHRKINPQDAGALLGLVDKVAAIMPVSEWWARIKIELLLAS